jgi:hypothetical protein
MGWYEQDSSESGQRPVVVLEHCSEPSGSIKYPEIIEQLSD